MSSTITVPPKEYGITLRDGTGTANLSINQVKMLNEYLCGACDRPELVIGNDCVFAIKMMSALLIRYRSEPAEWGDGALVKYTPEEGQARLDALLEPTPAQTVYEAMVDCLLNTIEDTPMPVLPSWDFANVQWDECLDADEDRNAGKDSLTLLVDRYTTFAAAVGIPHKAPKTGTMNLLKWSRIHAWTRQYFVSTFTGPQDITDLLNAYSVLIRGKDRPLNQEMHITDMFRQLSLATMCLVRVLMMASSFVRTDLRDRVWDKCHIEGDLNRANDGPGSFMTWETLGAAVAASEFVKKNDGQLGVRPLMDRDPDVCLETPVVGAICDALITASVLSRGFGPMVQHKEVAELRALVKSADPGPDRDFYAAVLTALTQGMGIVAMP